MRKLMMNYGMVGVLLALCMLFSLLTLNEQTPTGAAALADCLDQLEAQGARHEETLVVVGAEKQDSARFAETLAPALHRAGFASVLTVVGRPQDLREALEGLLADETPIAAIVTTQDCLKWRVLSQLPGVLPSLAAVPIVTPKAVLWPDFLKRSNLLAIVDRIVVIAIIAIGMTMVIITGGIDLSVGSLIALSAVIGTLLMKAMGGLEAPAYVVFIGFTAGVLACGCVGGLGGALVSRFRVAPFITTLGVMMMARGLAFMITGGYSIYQVPAALTWLGQGRTLGVPNTVLVLVVLYVTAHVFMSYTRMGRHIYAVGGNEEAARLSGVPIQRVIVLVYALSGLAAGLGGAIQASQLNTGTPTMGMMYELYVIAAVVVGGTSLAGGSGRILGTLIGAFIISVIQNGMNLLGIESYTQQVVLGGVILVAVLCDKIRLQNVSETGSRPTSAGGRLRPVWVGSVTLILVGLAGMYGVSAASSQDRVKIGVTCMDLTNPFFKLIADVMRRTATPYDYEIVALSANMDPAQQNNQLADFAAQGYDAIFLNPVDSKSAGEGVKKAYEAGVPVFTYDVQVTDPQANAMLVSHIGSDNFQGGRLAAASMMTVTGNRGKIAILSFPEVTSCVARVEGFRGYLKDQLSRLQIVTELSAKGSREEGYAVTTDLLQAHPDITGIFAINDPSALGAYAAVAKAAKLDQITIIGFDASPAGKQAVFEKKIYDTPQQFPAKMAEGTVQALLDYLEGKACPKAIFIPCAHYRYEDSIDDESRVAEQW